MGSGCRALVQGAVGLVFFVALRGVGGCSPGHDAVEIADSGIDAASGPRTVEDAAWPDADEIDATNATRVRSLTDDSIAKRTPVTVPQSARALSSTCPAVSLNASATNATVQNDTFDTPANVTFTFPGQIPVLSGSGANYLAHFTYTRPFGGAPFPPVLPAFTQALPARFSSCRACRP